MSEVCHHAPIHAFSHVQGFTAGPQNIKSSIAAGTTQKQNVTIFAFTTKKGFLYRLFLIMTFTVFSVTTHISLSQHSYDCVNNYLPFNLRGLPNWRKEDIHSSVWWPLEGNIINSVGKIPTYLSMDNVTVMAWFISGILTRILQNKFYYKVNQVWSHKRHIVHLR